MKALTYSLAVASIALVAFGCTQKVNVVGNTENPVAKEFLDSVSYPDGNYDSTEVLFYKDMKADFRKDRPSPLVIKFKADSTLGALLLSVAQDKAFEDVFITKELEASADSALVYNLVPGKEYFYRIAGKKNGRNKVLVKGTLKAEGPLRMIYGESEDFWNFRDIGGMETVDGKTIRYCKMYRGGQLNRCPTAPISAEDLEMLKSLGIRSDIDLRNFEELNNGTPEDPSDDLYYTPIDSSEVTYVNFPIDAYVIATTDSVRLSNLMKYIFNDVRIGVPCYVHCAAGADRTGTTFFLLEGLLGVKEEQVAKDYELTTFCMWDRTRNSSWYHTMIDHINSLKGETLRDRYETFFTDHLGISREEIEEFRNLMLE